MKLLVILLVSCLMVPLFIQDRCIAQTPQIRWWHDLNAPSFGSAAAADLDGDGRLEIAFGTYFNDEHLYVLNGEDGSLLWKYDTGGCNDASPVIADVDLDGVQEVVLAASSACRVFCFNGADGTVEWSFSTGSNCLDSPPAVADLDQDEKPEIVLGAWHGYVYCLNGENGSLCWKASLGTNSYIQSGPNVLDLDGDGALDVVVAQWMGDQRVYALKGTDGSVLWSSDLPQDHMYHGGSFGDIDEDGKPEIVIGCYDSRLYVLNGENGRPAWQYKAPFYIGAPTSIADLDHDTHLDIVFFSYTKVYALSHTGTLLWSRSPGGGSFRGAALADTNGDNVLDVVYGADDGFLRALSGDDGHPIWAIDLETHYGKTFDIDHAPLVADFDKDGVLDVFIVGGHGTSGAPQQNHGRAYMLSMNGATGPGWPMFRHDIRHSGCFDGYLSLECDTPTLPASTGGSAPFALKAGTVNAGRTYILLGGLSGTEPGTPLPGGAVLPLNWDGFTNLVLQCINSTFFANFMNTLDASGKGAGWFNTNGPLDPAFLGVKMCFAFALNNPWNFTSNAVRIEIVP